MPPNRQPSTGQVPRVRSNAAPYLPTAPVPPHTLLSDKYQFAHPPGPPPRPPPPQPQPHQQPQPQPQPQTQQGASLAAPLPQELPQDWSWLQLGGAFVDDGTNAVAWDDGGPGGDNVPSPLLQNAKGTHVEDILPWDILMRIFGAYHKYLFVLMPIVHWPTFLQRLKNRDDEKDRHFRSFVFALLSYSIIQLPRSALAFIPLRDLVSLHRRCFALSRVLQNKGSKDVTSLDIGCQHIYLATLMRKPAANAALGQAIRLAFDLRMHDDENLDLDPIEREVRRRIFWLLYGSDRTLGSLEHAPMQISDWDVRIPYPLAVDDEYITHNGTFSQPEGKTSLLAGFHYVSRMFNLLGVVLNAVSYRNPSPRGLPVLAPRLPPSSAMFRHALEGILHRLPDPIQISQVSTEPTDEAFAICRVNLLMTQAHTQLAIQRFAVAIGDEQDPSYQASTRRRIVDMLESMSSESLAANGDALRNKVLYFVMSSMLEPASEEVDTHTSALLSSYIRLREEQHANVLFEGGPSAVPSRSPSPQP